MELNIEIRQIFPFLTCQAITHIALFIFTICCQKKKTSGTIRNFVHTRYSKNRINLSVQNLKRDLKKLAANSFSRD